MTTRPLRLGAVVCTRKSPSYVASQARMAAESGFDVVLVPDHLGFSAPMPSLMSVAEAVPPSIRVGTGVINASFYRPALLARDFASVDSASNGRLEIGLGAGAFAEEFATAGLRFPSPAERVQRLSDQITQLRALLSEPDHTPRPIQQPPPILVAGFGRQAPEDGRATSRHRSRRLARYRT